MSCDCDHVCAFEIDNKNMTYCNTAKSYLNSSRFPFIFHIPFHNLVISLLENSQNVFHIDYTFTRAKKRMTDLFVDKERREKRIN